MRHSRLFPVRLLLALAITVACSCTDPPPSPPAVAAPDEHAGSIAGPTDPIVEPIAEAPSRLVSKSPCAIACADIALGLCDWQTPCSGDGFPYVPVCEGQPVPCEAAEVAASESGPYALEYCYRSCEGLN